MNKKVNLKKINLIKFFDQRNIGSIPRIFLSSIAIIFFFYSMPLIINFANNKNHEFQNNSNAVLAYTLKNGGKNIDGDNNALNEKDLLIDIFSLNDLETDTVRLNASTIKQLFEDTNYTLKDVREKKLVKPVALTLLPNEIKMIENTQKRKEFFIQIVLPLILKEIEKKIVKILDEKIRPAVAKDGGDIKFKEFKNGIVKVQLQGSCSGCPSSTMTLKQGVQNLLCHYIAEVKEVQAI